MLKISFNHKALFIAGCCLLLILGLIIFFSTKKTSSDLIVESMSIEDIYQHIKPSEFNEDTLVIFDIDNTIAYPGPNYHLGSEQWFYSTLENYQAQGMTSDQALAALLPLSFQILEYTWMVPVEPTTVHAINDLQKKGIIAIALTARSLDLTHRTLEQLWRIGIHFNGKGPAQCPIVSDSNGKPPALYIQGIIFSAGRDKGEALIDWLNQMNYHPKKIIFIDDKIKNITTVQKAVRKRNYPFVGLRYGYLDAYKKSITPEIMEKELQDFIKNNPDARPITDMRAVPAE